MIETAPENVLTGVNDIETVPNSNEVANKTIADANIVSMENDNVIELDTEVLEVIGKRLTSEKTLANPIHKDLAVRWKEIYQDGLPKDLKTELFNKYSQPENCVFLEAPKLNLEVKA